MRAARRAIHADAEKDTLRPELRQNLGSILLATYAGIVHRSRFRQRHADWMRPDQCELLVPIDREAVPLDPAFQGLVHGFQEIVAVRLNMEAEKIRAQQSIQEFPLPGTDPEGFRVGPRYVPEDCHPGIGPF